MVQVKHEAGDFLDKPVDRHRRAQDILRQEAEYPMIHLPAYF